jgi:hypothetical protein
MELLKEDLFMKRTALVLTAALLAAGCSTSSRKPTSAPPAPALAPAPPPVNEWNDRTFQLIKEKRWSQAVEAGQKAVAMDGKNSAAHFNLGRAYLGAGRTGEAAAELDKASELTGGANADVEYFRGDARFAAGQTPQGADIWAQSLEGPVAGDRVIADALQKILFKVPLPVVVGDVDGDGKPDLLRVADDHFRITSGTGQRLYDAPIMPATPRYTRGRMGRP